MTKAHHGFNPESAAPRRQQHSDNQSVAEVMRVLDLIDRPAALVRADLTIAGANRGFGELAWRLGLTQIDVLWRVVAPGERVRLAERVAQTGFGRETLDLMGSDGVSRSFALQRLGDDPAAVRLVVIEDCAAIVQPAATGLQHDAAGPLSAILGATELLLLRSDELPRDVRDRLGSILENCGRLSAMLAGQRGKPA